MPRPELDIDFNPAETRLMIRMASGWQLRAVGAITVGILQVISQPFRIDSERTLKRGPRK